MSLKASRWVWEHSTSAGLDRLVLLAIADHADEFGGSAWPSLTRLAEMCGMSRRSVIRSVERLVESGELERVRRGGRSGRGGMSNGYRIHLKWCQAGTSDGEALVPTGPEVVTDSHSSGDPVSPEPSRTVRTAPAARSQADPMARPPLDAVKPKTAPRPPKAVGLAGSAAARAALRRRSEVVPS